MRRIAIAPAKGGTGKTTTAVSLAHGLALRGRRVVLVDCDPKRHSALHFGLAPGAGLAALLRGGGAQAVEVREGLRVVDSGGLALTEVEAELRDRSEARDRLQQALSCVRDADYIILDCPPWLGPLYQGVLQSCDDVLLPVGADYLGLASAKSTLEEIQTLLEQCSVRYLGLLLTFWNSEDPNAGQVENMVREHFAGRVLRTFIQTSDALRAAPAEQNTVFEYEPLSRGAHDYALLTEEVEGDLPDDRPLD